MLYSNYKTVTACVMDILGPENRIQSPEKSLRIPVIICLCSSFIFSP